MKKKILCLLISLLCVLPLLAGCGGGDDDDAESGGTTKPLTLNLYGITGDSTTEEAILAVQDAMNAFTEGKYNTHIVLHLYPEAEYDKVMDEKLAEVKKRSEEEAANKKKPGGGASATTEAQTGEAVETYVENGVSKAIYPDEKDSQLDIFMVRGAANLNRYYQAEYLSSLDDALKDRAQILKKYLAPQTLMMGILGGKWNLETTTVTGTTYAIPNNIVCGEYTYLLVNKELAAKYYYSADDVKTLKTLANFLDDVAKNDTDYIPLYNMPVLNVEYVTDEPSLCGIVVNQATNMLARASLRTHLLADTSNFVDYYQQVYNYRKANYITEGDYYSLPEGENGEEPKIAAAFLKGNAALPAEYEDDYYVITYAKPHATASDRPGTMFCVSAYTMDMKRSMEIITALQTNTEFHNIFQYGVEGVNFEIDPYTGLVNILNDSYSMDYRDTGNLFRLTPSSSMDPAMLKLAENDWELGKKQNADTTYSPYALFDFRYITEENYKTDSLLYKAAVEAAKEEGTYDEETFTFEYPYKYTEEIMQDVIETSKKYFDLLNEFEEYEDEQGLMTLADYARQLRRQFEEEECYKQLTDGKNLDSPYAQYMAWYEACAPTA